MFNSIKNFCEKGENTGLLLVDMPTGSGKTHAVSETLDLSGYGTIDEIKRIGLQCQLKRMILQHNERQKDRKSRRIRRIQAPPADAQPSRAHASHR